MAVSNGEENETEPADTSDGLPKAIKQCQKTIIDTRAVIDPPRATPLPTKAVSPDLAKVLTEQLGVLRHTTTSLSLAFKPPITPAAAIQQIEKFVQDLCRIVSILIVAADGAGLASTLLLEEWTRGTIEVVLAAQQLVDTFEQSSRQPGSADDGYLVQTAKLWDAVDAMTGSLSTTESAALTRRWKAETLVIKDSFAEFKLAIEEMPRDTGSDSDEDGDERSDGSTEGPLDEWGDLEAALNDQTITEEELATIDKIKPVLALYQILQATLPRYFDSSAISLTDFLATSSAFVAAFDDAIFSLHPPHESAEISTALDALKSSAMSLVDSATSLQIGTDFCRRWREKHAEYSAK